MGKNMDKKKQLNVIYLVVALWGIVMFQSFWGHTASQVELSYSEFERYLEQGWLKDLVVDQQTIRGSFKEPIEGKDHFVTPRVDIDLAEKLAQYGEVYVNDAFGAAHRKHSSTHAINAFFKGRSYAGLLMKKE